jgi:hypothetical protein
VLATWGVWQERHVRAVEECEEVRNRSLKLYA